MVIAAAKPAYVASTYPVSQYSIGSSEVILPIISPLPNGYTVQVPSGAVQYPSGSIQISNGRRYVLTQPTVVGSPVSYSYGTPVQYNTAVVRNVPVVTGNTYTKTLPINSAWIY